MRACVFVCHHVCWCVQAPVRVNHLKPPSQLFIPAGVWTPSWVGGGVDKKGPDGGTGGYGAEHGAVP